MTLLSGGLLLVCCLLRCIPVQGHTFRVFLCALDDFRRPFGRLAELRRSDGSVAVGFVLGRFSGRLKTATSMLMVLSTAVFGLFAVAVAGWLPVGHDDTVTVAYATGILGGFFFNCTTPLYFEMLMETVCGWASENASGAVLILVNTVVQILFLAVPTKIDGSPQWMNWLTLGLFTATTSLVLTMRVEYRRSEVDCSKGGGGQLATALDDTLDHCGCF